MLGAIIAEFLFVEIIIERRRFIQVMKVRSLFVNKGLLLGLSYLMRHKKNFFKVLFVSLIGAALGSTLPLIFGGMVRAAVIKETVWWIIPGFIVVWAVFDQIYNWTTRYVDKYGAHIAWDASGDLFSDGMKRLIRLPMSYLGDQRLGKVVQRLDRSADYLERNIRDVAFSLLPHFTTAVLGITFAFFIHWLMGALLLCTVIFYTMAMTSKTKVILEKTRTVRKLWEEFWGYLWDVVNNVKAIKSNTTESFESGRIEINIAKPYEKEKEIEEIRGQLKCREHLIFGLGAVISLSTATYLLRVGAIDAGGLVAFLSYLSLVYKPFGQLAHNWRLIQESTIALERTEKFLALEMEAYDSGISRPMTGKVEFRNVAFSYGNGSNELGEAIFESLNFTVFPGETVALVGESGVGKTTLIDLISRYFTPLRGSVCIDGLDVSEWNLNSLRSQIAVVPQDVQLFNDNIKINIAYGDLDQLDSMESIQRAAEDAYAHDFITGSRFKNGYDQIVGERGVKVSTGQRQRIILARAFLRNANTKILILDEVTSALDSESERHIQEALTELKKGKTTFIIAHRLSTIRNADKIIVLDKSGVAEVGTHNELIRQNGIYNKFVELQSIGHAV